MTSRTVTTEAERGLLLKYIGGHPMPFTVSVQKGRKRSVEQNALYYKWIEEIALQLKDMTGDDEWTKDRLIAECKLRFGIPILREDDDDFRREYDEKVKPLDFAEKLEMMSPAFYDFPVTRRMKTEQMARYLDAVYKHFAERGLVLTLPEDHTHD